MNLGVWLTVSVFVIFTVFGVAFAYVVFLASEHKACNKEDASKENATHLEEGLKHHQ